MTPTGEFPTHAGTTGQTFIVWGDLMLDVFPSGSQEPGGGTGGPFRSSDEICRDLESPNPATRKKGIEELEALVRARYGRPLDQVFQNQYNAVLRRGGSQKISFDYQGEPYSFFIGRRST